MGAGASVAEISAEQLGEIVGGMKGALSGYRSNFTDNDINGMLLDSLDENGLLETLEDIGIENRLHRRQLAAELRALRTSRQSATPVVASPTPGVVSPSSTEAFDDSVEFLDTLTVPPSLLMGQMFQIQSIECFPNALDACVSKVVDAVNNVLEKSTSSGIPPKEYSCFLSYRVSSDAAVAEKMFLNLKLKGLNPFLDRQCLVAGEDWKVGFLRGLRNSSCFVPLISSAGLAPARDLYADHSRDNLLLEYQTALAMNEKRKAAGKPEYIVPVAVAKEESGGVFPFRDFASSMYSNTVGSQETPEIKARRELAELEARVASIDIDGCCNLVKMLREGDAVGRALAADALRKLAEVEDNQVRIASEGAIGPLIALVREGSAQEQKSAAAALGMLARNAENRGRIGSEGAIDPLLALVRAGGQEGADSALHAIQYLSRSTDIASYVGSSNGGIGAVVARLRSADSSELCKARAAGALCTLALNIDDNRTRIAREGAIGPLIALLGSCNADAKLNAVFALVNLAVNQDNSELIGREGGMGALNKLLGNDSMELKENVVHALWNLCFNARNSIRLINEGGFRPIIALLSSDSSVATHRAALALATATSVADDTKHPVLREGALAPLVALLSTGCDRGKEGAAHTLFNLSWFYCREIVDGNAIPPLMLLLRNGCTSAKKYAASALSKLAGENCETKNYIKQLGAVEVSREAMGTETDANCRGSLGDLVSTLLR